MTNYYSWTKINKSILCKKMDLSAFKYKGTSIPRDLYDFFNIKENTVHLDIELLYFGEKYSGKIDADKQSKPRYRLYWFKDFEKRIYEKFSVIVELAKSNQFSKVEDPPSIYFTKVAENSYEVSFDYDLSFFEESKIDFEKKTKISMQISNAERLVRLNTANKIPIKKCAITTVYDRNPDVVAHVLSRANGFCEKCLKPAPFIKASDGTPYLEVHHIITLADGGEDSIENTIAVCPNCHRELHYGI